MTQALSLDGATRLELRDGADFEADLAAAQAELEAAETGATFVFVLPPRQVTLASGLSVGAAGKHLHLEGQPGSELRFWDAGPLAGDVVGLSVAGDRVSLEGLTVRLEATGEATAVAVVADELAFVDDLRVARCVGAVASGLRIDGPLVRVEGLEVDRLVARSGDAVGAALSATELVLSRVSLTQLRASSGTATGLQASGERLSLTRIHVDDARATDACALDLRCTAADGEVELLDLELTRILASGGGATGLRIASTSPVRVVGGQVSRLRGARVQGALLVGAQEVLVHGLQLTDLRGRSTGVCGLRALLGAGTADHRFEDLHIEALRGGPATTSAAPPPSWTPWTVAALAALADDDALPAEPVHGVDGHIDQIVGLHLGAEVTGLEEDLDEDEEPGTLVLEQSVVRRVSGVGLQLSGGLRDLGVRGLELWANVHRGWLDGEDVALANITAHRSALGLQVSAAELVATDVLFTGAEDGPDLVAVDGTRVLAGAAWVGEGAWPLQEWTGAELPYVDEGPEGVVASIRGGVAFPEVDVDLRLRPEVILEAERVPGDSDDVEVYVGAWPPEDEVPCSLRDPMPPAVAALPVSPRPSPPVDYSARDYRALLAVMQARAEVVLPTWTQRGAADQTTMLLELLANRLDHLSWKQERAVQEGHLVTARTRRALEDHARLLDYAVDPGLSATAMIQLSLDTEAMARHGLHQADLEDRPGEVVLPAGTLVANGGAEEKSIVFRTEADLTWQAELDRLVLLDDVPAGATEARVDGELDALEEDAWLVLLPQGDEVGGRRQVDLVHPAHVVRVTELERTTGVTVVRWDPRRPAPMTYEAAPEEGEPAVFLGNVVCARHGVLVGPEVAEDTGLEVLERWAEVMRIEVTGTGAAVEVDLELFPVSRQCSGWPLPGETRHGQPVISVLVDGDPWDRIEDLSLAGPTDQVYVLRTARGGGACLRFGDDTNGAALPLRSVEISVTAAIGLGAEANVPPHTLTRLLALPGAFVDGLADPSAVEGLSQREEVLRRLLRLTNPLPAVGGREPEALERIRYRAPRELRELQSAVVLDDYADRLEDLPEVRAARARLLDVGPRRVVRVVVLLQDEDRLDEDERLRRWALARHHLEDVRLLGYDVEIVPPEWVPLDLDIVVDAEPWARAPVVEGRVREALEGAGGPFDPDTLGLGGDVHVSRVVQHVLDVPGVAAVRVHRLRRLEPWSPEHAVAGVLELGPSEVALLEPPYEGVTAGVLTVQVCGGQP